MKSKTFFLLLLFVFGVSGCKELADGDVGMIRIKNNSKHYILIHESTSYPDTTLINDRSTCEILPYETCEARSLHGWKGDIKSNEHGVIMFFVYDIDTINKYGSKIVDKEYKILKRYELTQTDLEKSNWTITFP